MQPFVFRLDRVLQWRQTQLSIEEIKVKQMSDRLNLLGGERDALKTAAHEALTGPAKSRSVEGADLAAVGAYYRRLRRMEDAVLCQIAEAERALEAQRQTTLAARRRVRLMEKLRDHRRREWEAEFARELDMLAAESSLARFTRMVTVRNSGIEY